MPNASHDTTAQPVLPSLSPTAGGWEQEVLPRLPDGWQDQAHELGAWQRLREIGSPADLLRGLMAYELHGYSFRQLGAWSLLSGVADISEAAWRKCLRRAGPWMEWMLTRKLAITTPQNPWLVGKGLRRVVLVDGTHLRCLGPKGETWRIHTAFDLLAGRLTEVQVTDRFVGEDWRRFDLQKGDLIVSDSINGYQEHIADALDEEAEVLVRFSPKTLPLYDEQGARITVLSWLKQRHAPAGRICSQKVWIHPADGSKRALRLVALRLTPEQTASSQRRKRKKAGQDGRKIQKDTLYLAGWLLVVTSLPEEQWSDAEVLALYRARWHIEMLFKRLKQLLKTHRLRCANHEAVKASIVLFFLCWVLQEDDLVSIRLELQEMQVELHDPEEGYSYPQPRQGQEHVISEWTLAAVCLDLLRQQVHGQISRARVQECLPRLQRFVRGSPRKRTHWYSKVCNWLRKPAA
jgi:hypothetical protein